MSAAPPLPTASPQSLETHLSGCYETGAFADAVVVVVQAGAAPVSLPAHRVILARADYFTAVLRGPCSGGPSGTVARAQLPLALDGVAGAVGVATAAHAEGCIRSLYGGGLPALLMSSVCTSR